MWDKFFKVIAIIGSIFLVWLFIVAGLNYSKLCEEVKEKNWNLQQQLRKCQEFHPFQKAVEEIGKKDYSEEYNCLDHTRDLQKELEKDDIKSIIFIGENREHAWLGVWIETTEGEFFNPSTDLKIIEIRDGDLNTICKCK